MDGSSSASLVLGADRSTDRVPQIGFTNLFANANGTHHSWYALFYGDYPAHWKAALKGPLDAVAGDELVLDLRSSAYAGMWTPRRAVTVRVLHGADWGRVQGGAGAGPNLGLISQAVHRVGPNVNGVPLGAKPSWLELSSPSPKGLCDFSKKVTGTDLQPGCALVAFPACELLAEVDLTDGHVVQAMRIGKAGAQPIDPAMNRQIATENTRRAPKRSAVQPLAGMNTASDSR